MRIVPIVLMVVAGALGGALGAEFLGAVPAVEEHAAKPREGGGRVGKAHDGGSVMAKDARAPRDEGALPPDAREAVALGRRLIVPVVVDRRTSAVVLLDLAVEVPPEAADAAHSAIPRLRDRFLRTMLSLAAAGAFEDGLADPVLLGRVRALLTRDARETLPAIPVEVLVMEALMRAV